MFDQSLPGPAELHSVDDAGLVEAIGAGARVSAACEGRRLAAIAELVERRCGDETDARQYWMCDPWQSAAAEIAAALHISDRRAKSQMYLALFLRDQVPQLNALLLAGAVDLRLVQVLKYRTRLVAEDRFPALDAAVAAQISRWGQLSDLQLEKKIDQLVEQHDPDAAIRFAEVARQRDVRIGDWEDDTGCTSIYGRVLAADAALFKKALAELVDTVCADDPRTLGQRRSDAVGALAVGADHLGCLCAHPDCAAVRGDARAGNVVIHLVADESALTAQSDPRLHGDDKPQPEPTAEPERVPESEREAEPEPASRPAVRPNPGVIVGGGIVPPALLAELIRAGAKVRYVSNPGPDVEPQHIPSAKLAEFIRMQDMTCRWPGCDRPADLSDIDHTVPWPSGVTHPSGIKCYCRTHHLLKTWWPGDWVDEQFPDGTITVTSPTGKVYTTKPGSSLLFPGWNITTAASPPHGVPPARAPGAELRVPKRQRTRSQDRASRHKAERARNAALNAEVRVRAAERNALLVHSNVAPTPTTEDDDPPPF